jgi:hypothetical protein
MKELSVGLSMAWQMAVVEATAAKPKNTHAEE